MLIHLNYILLIIIIFLFFVLIDYSAYTPSSKSFLYSLYNTKGFMPVKFELTSKPHPHATYMKSNYGPTFGAGHSFHISNNAGSNTGSYVVANSYKVPPGCASYTECFFGARNFKPTNIEVFYHNGKISKCCFIPVILFTGIS